MKLFSKASEVEQRDVHATDLESLDTEKTRAEIDKLRLELPELRYWRRKWVLTTLLSVAVPVGGILAFTATWVSAHIAERKHASEDRYNKAVEQLSSSDASVRLNSVATLRNFMCVEKPDFQAGIDEDGCATEGSFRRFWNALTSQGNIDDMRLRTREGTAVLIGRLINETDPAVLHEIAEVAAQHQNASITPLLSLNRSAAVLFARAAGDFAGVYILDREHKNAVDSEGQPYKDDLDLAVNAIDMITLRSGSPFEAEAKFNQSFTSMEFLVQPKCPFRELFRKQRELVLASYLHTAWFQIPPGPLELRQRLEALEKTAVVLEKSSGVIGRIAQDKQGLSRLLREDLFGVAIVVGELPPNIVKQLRGNAAFVQIPGDKTSTCTK